MKLHMIGCSHHNTSVQLRERIAFSPEQARSALDRLRASFPSSEAVLLSTCNRTELYTAAEDAATCPSPNQMVQFVADFHGLPPTEVAGELRERNDEDAVRHLFMTAASLDSMIVGEAQILSQVKQAYELANDGDATGPLTHATFQAAIRVAKRIANETAIHRKRVSIPSVAVAEYACQFFERFDDKQILVIGAGEMGEETLRYLINEDAKRITIVNRHLERAQDLAMRTRGEARPWDELTEMLVKADLVVSTTGATEPIVTAEMFGEIASKRYQKPLFILDLAVPRDFEPAVGDSLGVYLYSVDDLSKVCAENRKAREKEWPKAARIIDDETNRFMREWYHRSTGPWIRRLRSQADAVKQTELERLLNKCELNDEQRGEVERALDRVVNKLLHPPLESLRDEAKDGVPHGLIDALKRLFKLSD